MFGSSHLDVLPILGLVIVATFIVLRRQAPGNGKVRAKLLAMFAAMFVAAIVPAVYFVRSPDSLRAWVSESNTSITASTPSVSAVRLPDSRDVEPAKLDAALPEWTRQSTRIEDASKLVVVRSGRFATLEEAELHALDDALQAAAQHFRHLDPTGIGRFVPTQRELVREAIQDRFEEISRHDLGTMKEFPMHQVWLQVKLSPQLGERFAAPWRQAAIAARLHTLAGWSIWSTAVAGLIAFALRLDSAWNGRRRAVVVGTTVALMLGSLALVA